MSRSPAIAEAIEDTPQVRSSDGELPDVLVWHSAATDYRRALMRRLPGVRVTAMQPSSRALSSENAGILLAWTLPESALTQLPSLRWLHATGAGVEHLIDRPDLAAEVRVTRSLGRFGVQVAEYTLGYLLHLLIGIEGYRRDQDRALWEKRDRPLLTDMTVGVLGLGSLGGVVAERLSALGVNVLGLCRSGKPRPHVSRVFSPDNWRSMLPLCDALVLTTPLTPQTHGMLDAAALAALPAGAVLVNVARGELVDERALLESVRQGRLRAAVLDVFDREPLPADSPLWTEPRIWVTPHVAAPSEVDLVADEFAINYSRFIDGAPLVNLVDRERGY